MRGMEIVVFWENKMAAMAPKQTKRKKKQASKEQKLDRETVEYLCVYFDLE